MKRGHHVQQTGKWRNTHAQIYERIRWRPEGITVESPNGRQETRGFILGISGEMTVAERQRNAEAVLAERPFELGEIADKRTQRREPHIHKHSINEPRAAVSDMIS